MKAALYARVSTEDQAKNYSIPSQFEAMRKFSTEQGFEVVQEFVDEGISGALLNRPALDELRDLVRHKLVDAVIVYDPDRLSRKLVHLMIIAEEIEKQGVQLRFVTQTMGQNPEDKMLFGMKGLFAEYERTKIIERTVRGRLRKAKQDGKQPGGRPLFGYKLVNGKHEIDEDEAKIVRMIFDWLVKDSLSLFACQMRLNKLGIPSPSGKQWWSRAGVYRIISNPAYIGEWYYNRRIETSGDDGIRDKKEWISIAIPAIIPKEDFEQIQLRLNRNKALSARNTKHEYLLSGLLVCGKCGRSVHAKKNGKYTYYECRSAIGYVTPEPCPNFTVRQDKLELLVWDSVSKLLQQPEKIKEQMKLDDCKPLEHLNAQLSRISQVLAKKTLEADRILEAYKIGAIDLPKLKDTMDEIKTQESKLAREKETLEAELQKAKTQELSEERLHDFCNSLPSVLTSLDYIQKRQILKEVVDKIVIDGETVKIYGIIKPPPEGTEDTAIVLHSSKGDTEGFIFPNRCLGIRFC